VPVGSAAEKQRGCWENINRGGMKFEERKRSHFKKRKCLMRHKSK